MTKHARKSAQLQLVDSPRTTSVKIPLPLLGAFAKIQNSFFDLCVEAGQLRPTIERTVTAEDLVHGPDLDDGGSAGISD